MSFNQIFSAESEAKMYMLSFQTHLQWCGEIEPECDKCYKSEKELTEEGKTLKYCGKCKSIKYCSKECQEGAWDTHKLKCKQFDFNFGDSFYIKGKKGYYHNFSGRRHFFTLNRFLNKDLPKVFKKMVKEQLGLTLVEIKNNDKKE